MLKLGIYNLKQLTYADTTFLRKELKTVSITLYNQITDTPEGNAWAERILLLFTDDRGAYKRTYSKRFEEFDNHIMKILGAYRFPDDKCVVHDIAVSDARTACDFFEKLASKFPKLRYYASDYEPEVTVVESGRAKIALNSKGKILEILYPPFVFNTVKRDSYRHYPLNHLIRLYLQYAVVPNILAQHQKGELADYKLQLFCPKALNLAKKDQRFHLLKHNILEAFPLSGQTTIVRAMNILNSSYFSAKEMVQAIHHIHTGLAEGGVFIFGSNQESNTPVCGAIFQKTNCRFKKIWQSDESLEVLPLIEQFDATQNLSL